MAPQKPPTAPPVEVELPDGTILEFPAGTDPAVAAQKGKDYLLKQRLENFPTAAKESAKGFFSALGQMVVHPERLAQLVTGAMVAVQPKRWQDQLPDPLYQAGQNVRDIGTAYADRYGGVENIRNTFLTDPVGMSADLSMLLGGAGGAAKVAGLPRVGRTLAAASTVTDPVRLPFAAARAAGRGVMDVTGLSKGYRQAAEKFQTAAFKPPAWIQEGVEGDIGKQAVTRRAVAGSARSLRREQAYLEGLKAQATQIINDWAQAHPTARFDPDLVTTEVQNLLAKQGPGTASSRIKAIQKVLDEWVGQTSTAPPTAAMSRGGVGYVNPQGQFVIGTPPRTNVPMTAQEMEAARARIGQEVTGSYTKDTRELAGEMQARQAQYRGASNALKGQIGELGPVRAEETRQIPLVQAMEHRRSTARKLEVPSLQEVWAGHSAIMNPASPRAWAYLGAAAARRPQAASRLANYFADIGEGKRVLTLPGSSNRVVNPMWNLFSPTRLTTPKTELERLLLLQQLQGAQEPPLE